MQAALPGTNMVLGLDAMVERVAFKPVALMALTKMEICEQAGGGRECGKGSLAAGCYDTGLYAALAWQPYRREEVMCGVYYPSPPSPPLPSLVEEQKSGSNGAVPHTPSLIAYPRVVGICDVVT